LLLLTLVENNTLEKFLKNGIVSENENIMSTKNETCGIFLNDVLMEEMFEDYPSLETKSNRVLKNEELLKITC
jgi:hypothetical protein